MTKNTFKNLAAPVGRLYFAGIIIFCRYHNILQVSKLEFLFLLKSVKLLSPSLINPIYNPQVSLKSGPWETQRWGILGVGGEVTGFVKIFLLKCICLVFHDEYVRNEHSDILIHKHNIVSIELIYNDFNVDVGAPRCLPK